MTDTAEPGMIARRVWFHDPYAPAATTVAPSAFVAVRNPAGAVLLVRRRDSGVWELPGGRVDIGESATDTACRETLEEAGVAVRITGMLGLYTDPAEVVRGADGVTRQQFAVLFRAEIAGGTPHPDGVETDAVAWVDPDDVAGLAVEPGTRIRIDHVFAAAPSPHIHPPPAAGTAPHRPTAP